MDLSTWVDHEGNVRKTPQILRRLKYGKIPLHRAIRAFVIVRDGFKCVECGTRADPINGYDGRSCPSSDNGSFLLVDHIISRRCGGSHHPSNLQCLCDSCNSAKSTRDRLLWEATMRGQVHVPND